MTDNFNIKESILYMHDSDSSNIELEYLKFSFSKELLEEFKKLNKHDR